jgi:nicotinate-nucleotide adenylyltransferase
MLLSSPLGLFGGTFDPVHLGHILPITAAAGICNVSQIALIPNYLPSHKQAANSSPEHRLAMLDLVCADYPLFYTETWELEQQAVSYSFYTIEMLRKRYPQRPLCFFIGSDSLYSLPTWHRWQELLGLCHFVVCQREIPKLDQQAELQKQQVSALLAKHQVADPQALHTQMAGCIYLANTMPFTVSSTWVRAELARGRVPNDMLPKAVSAYILEHKLYQSSAII